MLSVELTMLWEEHCEKANERKSFKYTNLMVDRRIDDCANLAVSCWGRLQRGLQLQSVWKLLTRIEISQRVIPLDMTLWRRSVIEVVVHRLHWIGHHCWGSNGSGSKDHLMTIGTDKRGGTFRAIVIHKSTKEQCQGGIFFHPSKMFWKI